jgi:ATP-dependent Clp protease ATP-binding subunit ClpA
MFERFTNQSRRVVVLAQEEARMLNHNYIGTEHLLLGLLHEGSGTAATALTSAGITLEAAQVEVESVIGQGKELPSGHIPFTARAKKCLELSLREALQLGDNYIGTGHLLLGLISKGDGVGVQVLERLGADLGQLRHRVTVELENDPEAGGSADEPALVRPSRQGDTIRRLLDTIDSRLSSIEGHLGITRAEPTARPAGGAAEPEAGGAAEPEAGGAGGGSPAAGGAGEAGGDSPEAGGGLLAVAEIGRLNAEVTRLKALLREHEIDPGEPGTQGAATG